MKRENEKEERAREGKRKIERAGERRNAKGDNARG